MNPPSNTPPRSVGRTILRNSTLGIAAQVSLRIISFVFNILVIRQLGGEQYGQYQIVLAWAALFSVLGDAGVTQYFAREVARNHEETTQYFWDVVVIRFILALVTSVITTLGAIAYGYSTEIVIAITLFTGTYFLQAFLAPLLNVINGNERVDITAFFEVVGQVIFMVAGGLFLFAGKDFLWLVIATFFNLPVLLFMSVRVVRRNHFGPPRFHINPQLWRRLIIGGLPFAMIQLSLSFALRLDTVILSAHVPDEHVGWYNAAYNLTLSLLMVSRTFNTAILPTLAREHTHDPNVVRTWYFRSVKMLLFISLPLAVGTMVMAYPIVEFLYRPELIAASIALAILAWDVPFAMYHSFCGNITQSITRERSAAVVYGSLGIVNLVLNLILIPRFGIIGASFSTVLTDMVGALSYYVMLRHEFGPGLNFSRVIRLAAAAAVMGLVIEFIRDWNVLVVAGAGLLIYLAVVWVSGAFSSDERHQLIGFASRLLNAVTHRLRPNPV